MPIEIDYVKRKKSKTKDAGSLSSIPESIYLVQQETIESDDVSVFTTVSEHHHHHQVAPLPERIFAIEVECPTKKKPPVIRAVSMFAGSIASDFISEEDLMSAVVNLVDDDGASSSSQEDTDESESVPMSAPPSSVEQHHQPPSDAVCKETTTVAKKNETVERSDAAKSPPSAERTDCKDHPVAKKVSPVVAERDVPSLVPSTTPPSPRRKAPVEVKTTPLQQKSAPRKKRAKGNSIFQQEPLLQDMEEVPKPCREALLMRRLEMTLLFVVFIIAAYLTVYSPGAVRVAPSSPQLVPLVDHDVKTTTTIKKKGFRFLPTRTSKIQRLFRNRRR